MIPSSVEVPLVECAQRGQGLTFARLCYGCTHCRLTVEFTSQLGQRTRQRLAGGLGRVRRNLGCSIDIQLAGARKRFPALPEDAAAALPADTDLVLVWGEGFSFAQLPPTAKVIYLNSWLQPENGHADVFLPISVQTERSGRYTNFQGVVSAFEACFEKKPGVADAQALFAALGSAP